MAATQRTQPIHLLLLVLGAFTGVLLTAQLVSEPAENVDPFAPLVGLQESIDVLSREQTDLQDSIAKARDEVQNLESVVASGTRKTALDALKADVGLTEITGHGVEIKLDDTVIDRPVFSETPPTACYAADLRDILNILQVGGATATSINGQRVIDSTSVICVGQNVLVNNTRMLPPFTILAVGDDPAKLVTYLQTEKFLPELHARAGNSELVFQITQRDKVTVPVYKGNLESNFMQ